MIKTTDIQIVAGDNRELIITVTDASGMDVPLSNASVSMAVCGPTGEKHVLTGTVSETKTNTAAFQLPADVYGEPGDYSLQLKIEMSGNIRILPSGGNYGHLTVTRSLFT